MKIEEIQIFTFQLPLLYPLQIGNTSVTSRSGAIVHLKTNTNFYGFGEASPLPGLHQENLDRVINQLVEVKSLLLGTHREKWFEVLKNLIKKDLSSCVQFAIESAILNIEDQVKMSERNTVLPDPEHNNIYINALATGDDSTILQKIEQSISENYRAVKVKVGKKSAEEEFKLINTIRGIVDDKVTLRLDANQAWEFDEAVTYIQALKDVETEYIEEPLKNPANLPDLFEKTGLRIAVDESLINIPPVKIKSLTWINTLILKPSVIGSVRKTLQYINLARELGLKVVISDTFHSGIGLSFLIRLASTITELTPMGFDTYKLVKR